MAAKVYPSKQLLTLRGQQYSEGLIVRAKDRDITDILRVSDNTRRRMAARMAAEAQRLTREVDAVKENAPDRTSGDDTSSGETEWKYRGRTDSEVSSSQPIPAPPGLSAQKDEGFQKFYRAVVSPTHVRVTAGGRIVPNTRNGCSPTSKWAKDKLPQDPLASRPPQLEHAPCLLGPAPFPGAFPGFPMYPGMHPGMMAGPGSMPLVPIPVGYGMYGGFAVPQFAFNHVSGARAPAMALAQPSTGPAPYPEFRRQGGSQPVYQGPDAPAKAPQSSIRESEITKKQLDGLRGTLKYVEDQLQYNKHQIDERAMEGHAQNLRGLIQRFESTLDLQLVAEAGVSPQLEQKKDIVPDGHPAKVPPHTSSKPSTDPPAQTSVAVVVQPPPKASLPVSAALAPPFQPAASTMAFAPVKKRSAVGNVSESDDWARIAKVQGLPYLVGRVPAGVDPSAVQESDYVYPRKLTEDEKKARHLYWGDAPAHVRKGLPKFDGKNFYPASPVRGSSGGSSSRGSMAMSRDSSAIGKSHESETSSSAAKATPAVQYYTPHESPRKGLSVSEDNGAQPMKKPDKTTRSEVSSLETRWNDQHDLLNGLRKRRTRMATSALPGAVTSMTATGYLPQYSGQAAALLTPALASAAASPRSSPVKPTTSINENMPPVH